MHVVSRCLICFPDGGCPETMFAPQHTHTHILPDPLVWYYVCIATVYTRAHTHTLPPLGAACMHAAVFGPCAQGPPACSDLSGLARCVYEGGRRVQAWGLRCYKGAHSSSGSGMLTPFWILKRDLDFGVFTHSLAQCYVPTACNSWHALMKSTQKVPYIQCARRQCAVVFPCAQGKAT